MKARTIIGIAAIGGFMYLHFRRGGQLTYESFVETGRHLFGRASTAAADAKDRTEKKVLHDLATTVAEATETH